MNYLFDLTKAFLVAIAFLFLPWSLANAEEEQEEILVTVERKGEVVTVDASFTVPVKAQLAWEVLTDYENMAEFLPQLDSSKVLNRNGNRLRVSQNGRIFVGPIPLSFDYLRDVELTPYSRMRSVVIGGSLKSGEVITQLMPTGETTRIIYHSKAVPNIWIPLGISEAFIRNSVQEQLVNMRKEMERREGRGQ